MDQYQPNSQLESPGYHLYVSLDNEYRPSRSYIGETNTGTLAFQYSRSANLIAGIRAGLRSKDLKETVYLFVSVWYALKLQKSYGL